MLVQAFLCLVALLGLGYAQSTRVCVNDAPRDECGKSMGVGIVAS